MGSPPILPGKAWPVDSELMLYADTSRLGADMGMQHPDALVACHGLRAYGLHTLHGRYPRLRAFSRLLKTIRLPDLMLRTYRQDP